MDVFKRSCTASKFETGGNHVVEAIACNLPVLYHLEGGGICDLSKDYGSGYSTIEEFEIEMNKLIKNIEEKDDSFNFKGTLEDVCIEYVLCMEKLHMESKK